MTPEQRAKKLLEPYRKQTHPEEDPGFDAMEKDIAQEIERLTAENEKLRAENTDFRLALSRLGWDNPDRLLSYQQQTPTCLNCGKPALGNTTCEKAEDPSDPRHRVMLGMT